MTYNVWNKWDKLKTVMLGTCHPLEFYDKSLDPKVRDPLLRITEETLEDLEYYESVLKDFGCQVLRPPTDHDTLEHYLTKRSMNIPRSALQPRDTQLVIGNKLVVSGHDNQGIIQTLKHYNSQDIKLYPGIFEGLKSNPQPNQSWNGGFMAPCVTVVNNKIFYDTKEINEQNVTWLKQNFPTFEYVPVSIGGHNDACFHTIKPGAIISLHEIQTYENTFPDWDVCYLPDQSWDKVEDFIKVKHKTFGKWWIPGEESNDALANWINTWLNDWVGYVEETVFDVNVLVLDERHVCISNPNNAVINNFLKTHAMEPIHIPWRHRYFWDGGLHCITLDLEREGSMASEI